MDPFTIAGLATSVGSSIFGGINSAAANRRARRLEQGAHNRANAYYMRNATPYLETSAGMNMMRRANDIAERNWKRAQGAAAVGGGTDASVALAKESSNKMLGDAMANASANDSQRMENTHRAMANEAVRHGNAMQNYENQQAANISQVASSASDALLKLGSSLNSESDNTEKVKEEIDKSTGTINV